MINAEPTAELKRSRFPFSPLVAVEIPDRLTVAAMDYVHARGGVDSKQAGRIMFDLEKRARLDAYDLEHLERKAMTYAGTLGEIDALHIEWGSIGQGVDDIALWTRLGRILREAGI